MQKLTKTTAIAYREFTWADDPDQTVVIYIGQPLEQATGEWLCPYRIVGAGRDFNFGVFGIDGMQCLQEVFKLIDATLIGDDFRLLEWGRPFMGFCDKDMANLW